MTRRHVVRAALVGLFLGLAAATWVTEHLEPSTDIYAVRRNAAGLGDVSLILGFPTAFAVMPWFINDEPLTLDSTKNRTATIGLFITLGLNGALWGMVVGALVVQVVESASRPSA